jgi:hypothetical protein
MEREAIFPLAQFAPIGRHFSIRVFGNSVTSCNIAAQIWLFGACIIQHASKCCLFREKGPSVSQVTR